MAKRRAAGEGGVFETPKGSGQWRAFVSDCSSGKQCKRWVRGKTQADVLVKQRELRDQVAIGLDGDKYRLKAWLERWFADDIGDSVAATTKVLYRGLIDNHIVPKLGNVWLRRLNPLLMQGFFADLERDKVGWRVRQQIRGNILIPSLDRAVQYRLIPANPARAVRRPTGHVKQFPIFTHDQLEKFLVAIKGHTLYGLFAVAAMTGARSGELLALRQADYDANHGILRIRHSLRDLGGKLSIAECKTPKSKRSISLPPRAIEALRVQREWLLGKGLRACEWLFPNEDGNWLRNEYVARKFHEVCEKFELPRIRFHDLRHCHASELLALGVDIQYVSARLGHANVTTTLNCYAHLMASQEKRATEILAALWS